MLAKFVGIKKVIMDGLKAAAEIITRSNTIAISGHVNPDGDSIGSLLGLGLGLKSLGKRVILISEDGVPGRYTKLPGVKEIVRRISEKADLAIAVDCSNKEILGKTHDAFKRLPLILEIDHHEFRRPFGNIALIDKKAAAVGEVIYKLLIELNADIKRDAAQNLLTSIIVETNSFSLPNVRPYTFEVCTELINKKVDFYRLVDMIFWSQRRESVVLSGLCLSRCRFEKNNRMAWSFVNIDDFKRYNAKSEDVDGVPDEIRSIKGVEIAVLFRQDSKDTLRVSLRSKGGINVASVAERFNGGGHFDVAGCTIADTERSVRDLLKYAGQLLQRSPSGLKA